MQDLKLTSKRTRKFYTYNIQCFTKRLLSFQRQHRKTCRFVNIRNTSSSSYSIEFPKINKFAWMIYMYLISNMRSFLLLKLLTYFLRLCMQISKIKSILQMFNRFPTNRNLPHTPLNNLSHLSPPIQHPPSSLILLNIHLNLIQQLFINLFILMYKCKYSINLPINTFISINSIKMLFP